MQFAALQHVSHEQEALHLLNQGVPVVISEIEIVTMADAKQCVTVMPVGGGYFEVNIGDDPANKLLAPDGDSYRTAEEALADAKAELAQLEQ